MTLTHIAAVAILASAAAAEGGLPDAEQQELLMQLHDYARERKFPPAETLARKYAELRGQDLAWPSLADADEATQRQWVTFRAVLMALEPFREGKWLIPLEGEFHRFEPVRSLLADTGAGTLDELRDMARVGMSLMRHIDTYCGRSGDGPLKFWVPAEDPAEIVGDLVALVQERDTAIAAQAEQIKARDERISAQADKLWERDERIAALERQLKEKADGVVAAQPNDDDGSAPPADAAAAAAAPAAGADFGSTPGAAAFMVPWPPAADQHPQPVADDAKKKTKKSK